MGGRSWPELFLSPRGLITILLFFSIPEEYVVNTVFHSEIIPGILLFIILGSALAMSNALIGVKKLEFEKKLTEMEEEGKDTSSYERENLMDEKYDDTELGKEADERIRTFQADAAKQAGIFHHLITLPTYHTAALSTDNLAKEYFGEKGMLGYVEGVQRKEIREGIACVKHQNMAGSDMGDDHKEYFAGEAALKAAGEDNTMNQF